MFASQEAHDKIKDDRDGEDSSQRSRTMRQYIQHGGIQSMWFNIISHRVLHGKGVLGKLEQRGWIVPFILASKGKLNLNGPNKEKVKHGDLLRK